MTVTEVDGENVTCGLSLRDDLRHSVCPSRHRGLLQCKKARLMESLVSIVTDGFDACLATVPNCNSWTISIVITIIRSKINNNAIISDRTAQRTHFSPAASQKLDTRDPLSINWNGWEIRRNHLFSTIFNDFELLLYFLT